MNKELLVKFEWDGYYGSLSGLFITTREEIDSIDGKNVYFGEVLGKHSELLLEMEESDFVILSSDTSVIAMVRHLFGVSDSEKTLIGYNPFDYFDDENK